MVQQFRLWKHSSNLVYFIFPKLAQHVSSAEPGWVGAQMATKEEEASFLLHTFPPLVPLAVSHIAKVWALTPWKWTPERSKEDRDLLRAHCPWQVTALPSVRFSHPFTLPLLLFVLSVLCAQPNLFQLCWYIHYCIGGRGRPKEVLETASFLMAC